MITKFEKRVLAFLLAGLLCVPVTAVPSVTANAEETESTVQQDDQQTVEEDVQTSTSETQEDAEEQQLTTGNQENEASGGEAGNDLSDGAFVPIEEEQDEKTDDKAQQTENNSVSEPKEKQQEDINDTVDAEDLIEPMSEEDMEHITVGRNLEAVTKVTEFSDYEYMVSYSLTAEETGKYYLNLSGDGGIVVWDVTDGNEDWVYSESNTNGYLQSGIDLEAGKEYILDVSYYGSEASASLEWEMGFVPTANIGINETEIKGSYGRAYYFLETEGDGLYCLKKDDQTTAEITIGGETTVYYWETEILFKADSATYIAVYYNNFDGTGTISWELEKLDVPEVKEGEQVHTVVSTNDLPPIYKFIPQDSGRYMCTASNIRIYDEKWDSRQTGIMEMNAGEIYYIYFNNYYNHEEDWSINRLKETEIEAGKPYRVLAGDNVYFKFVPEESCQYSISWQLDIYDSSWSQIWDSNLTAGDTYYLMPDNSNNSFYFEIEKAEESAAVETVKVEAGGSYITPNDTTVQYTFTPEEDGKYHFWSDETAYIKVGENSRTYGFDYWGDFKAGQEYPVSITFPSSADWDVNWHIGKASTLSITEGTAYTSSLVQSQEYVYTPEKTGYYFISSDDIGECAIYDSESNKLTSYSDDIYDYIDENGFGAVVYMEEGQEYYIHIIPGEEEATWQINPLETEGDYIYRALTDNTAEILSYKGSDASVEIPSSIDGKDVVSIGYGAFRENYELKNVTIPSKVTELQYGAFYHCANLLNVTMEEGSELQSIGNMAFYQCTELNDINLPDTVQKIESQAFYCCVGLENINLGSQLKEIGNYAFYYDGGLTEITLPDSLTTLGDHVFGVCGSLEKVTLGSGLKGIEAGTFSNCESLAEIEIPENITYIADSAFSSTALTRVDIPDTVTSVGNSAFAYCSNLQEVNIGSNVTYIADGAFSGCDLRELTINGEIESIGDSAFLNNKNLESIEIPSSVTRIEYRAFSGCSSLLEIEIPDSVEAIAGFAFDSTNNNANTEWYDSKEDGVVYAGKVLYKYKGEAPEGTTITVEDGTKGIAGYAFYWQYNLKEIQLPNTVTNIGDYAFYACESMKEIHIPQSVTEIGEYALGYLDNRSNIKVPGFTIYGVAGTVAETYAKENGFTFTAVEPEVMPGDVDESGNVDISDLRLVLRAVCGKVTLTSTQKLAADVEKDNNVDIQDLRKILRYVCHKIDSFE